MLKLTMVGPAARPIFVNPKMVAHIYPRAVRERVTPDPPPPGTMTIEYASRVEGSFVNFGTSGDDSDVPVMEGAEDIAREVAAYSYGIVDIAAETKARAALAAAEQAQRSAAGCTYPANPNCECSFCTDLPF